MILKKFRTIKCQFIDIIILTILKNDALLGRLLTCAPVIFAYMT